MVICSELVGFAEGLILGEKKWSVDAAIGCARDNRLFDELATTKTFYNWIDDGLVKVGNLDLLLKVRRRHKRPRRERNKGNRKKHRPPFERSGGPRRIRSLGSACRLSGDGIVGAGQKGHLMTLVERKLGIGFLFNVGDRKSDKIIGVIDALEKRRQKKGGEVSPSLQPRKRVFRCPLT